MEKISGKVGILWFRQDLRLHDNEALTEALQLCENIIPVYVFDERLYGKTARYGFKKTGLYRAKFIWESVQNLKKNLQKAGSDLVIRWGKPEEEIFHIANQVKSNWVLCNRERTREEVEVQDALEENLWAIGQELRYYRGKMLYYTGDLPFPVPQTPDVFTQYRKEVEKIVSVRKPFPSPDRVWSSFGDLELGQMPSIEKVTDGEMAAIDDRVAFSFPGGEDEGLNRLNDYIWETECISTYKKTRNELLGANYSSKFSAYLAQGCLSPKQIYQQVEEFEQKVKKNSSTYWLKFELMWRDFYRLMAKKYTDRIFLYRGPKGEEPHEMHENWDRFQAWAKGMTGIPFIDANIREINATGYMSNRGRQNVASYLIKDLRVDWRMGAEYFESLLIDYDPASNYGNWNYLAGVGSDPMENRYFNILSQARRYDSNGDYVRQWMPELSDFSGGDVHKVYDLPENEWVEHNLHLNYTRPLIQPDW